MKLTLAEIHALNTGKATKELVEKAKSLKDAKAGKPVETVKVAKSAKK